MRNSILSLFLFVLLPLAAGAEEAKITALSGNVEVRQTRDGQWASAALNMEIPEGGSVRTGSDGAAILLMPNKTKVWLKDTSTLEVEQRQTLASRLALVFGRIKIRVPHLMRKEKFEVRTPAAVCAVRGTEFTMDTTEDGKMNLQVLFGEVKLKYAVPPEKGRSEFNIPQGQGLNIEESGKSAKPALLTAANERAAMENWNPGMAPAERQKGLQEKENDRAQIKEFAKITNSAENTVKSFLNVVKESDLEAGRTMNDMHGNLVRVDQRMIRPDNNTLQFFNLVKRPNYADFTASGDQFAYNGGAVANRLDLMQMSINFDHPLPQRIEEWPAFFNGNEIKLNYTSMITANRTNKDEIFVIAEGARYDAASDGMVDDVRLVDRDNLAQAANFSDWNKHTIITGILADEGTVGHAQEMLNALSRLAIKDTVDANGRSTTGGQLQYKNAAGTYTSMNTGGTTDMLWAMNMTPTSGVSSWSSEGDPYIWQHQADAYAIGNKAPGAIGASDYIFVGRETYVINNGGQVQQVTDFTNSSLDPFSILKNSGAETIAYIKKGYGNYVNGLGAGSHGWLTEAALFADINNTASGDRFSYSATYGSRSPNIDVIFIPDLFLAAVQRMLPALTKMGD